MGWPGLPKPPRLPNPVRAIINETKRVVPGVIKTVVGSDSYDSINPFNNNDEAVNRARRAAASRIAQTKGLGTARLSGGMMGTPKDFLNYRRNAGVGMGTPADFANFELPSVGVGMGTPTDFIDFRKAAADAYNRNQGGGRGSSGSGSSGPSGPSQTDLLNSLYGDLLGRIGAMGDQSEAGYAAGKAAVKQNYLTASEDLYNRYLKSRDEMVPAAQNLGATFEDTATQAILRRIQETNDLSSATDQSWFDKMSPLQQDLFDQVKIGISMDQIARQQELAAAARNSRIRAARGSGGRSGGGSSTTGPINVTDTDTGTATDTYTYPDTEQWDRIQSVKANDPLTGAMMEDAFLSGIDSQFAGLVKQKNLPYIPTPKSRKVSNPWNPTGYVKQGAKKLEVGRANKSIASNKATALETLRKMAEDYINNPKKKTTVTQVGRHTESQKSKK